MKNDRKLKVALVFDDSLDSNDGVAQYVKRLGAWLSDQDHEVSYLVGQTKLSQWHNAPVYSLAKNMSVRFNGNKLSMPLAARSKIIKDVLNQQDFDIVHVMVPYSPLLAQRIIKLVPDRTPIIGTFHIFPSGKLSVFGSKLLKLLLRRSLKRFSAIISVSQPSAEFARAAFDINSQVIPNPVDIHQFTSAAKAQPKSYQEVFFLGRLVKRKGAEQLIDAFKILHATLPDVHLTVAGAGAQMKKLKAKIESLGLNDRVRFLGYIKEADKPKLLKNVDIACFPSLNGEAFGIVLVEAMAAGAGIVLGGDNPGYRSVLGEQPQLLIDPTDTAAFAARLELLLSDKKLAAQLHQWQNLAIKQYDIHNVGNQILDLYIGQIARAAKKSNN